MNKLTIEQMREIVANAPMWASGWNIVSKSYFSGDMWSKDQEFYIEDLIKSIADHDITEHITSMDNHISPLTKVIER